MTTHTNDCVSTVFSGNRMLCIVSGSKNAIFGSCALLRVTTRKELPVLFGQSASIIHATVGLI